MGMAVSLNVTVKLKLLCLIVDDENVMPFYSLKKVQLSHGLSNDIALGEVCQSIKKGA